MKKKTILLIAAAVALVAVLAAGVVGIIHLLQNRPGVHVKDGSAQVNLEMPCYIYNRQTENFEAPSTIRWKTKGFLPTTGMIEEGDITFIIDAFPMTENYMSRWDLIRTEDGCLQYRGDITGIWYSQEKDGSYSTHPGILWGNYAEYDLSTHRLCAQVITKDGDWYVALAGFGSQDAALEYLHSEGSVWLEEAYARKGDFPL